MLRRDSAQRSFFDQTLYDRLIKPDHFLRRLFNFNLTRLKKEENQLSKHFKDKLSEGSIQLGHAFINIRSEFRESLDKDALKAHIGEAIYNKFIVKKSKPTVTLTVTRQATVAVHPMAWTGLLKKEGGSDE